ncbi:hypothetical protein DV736_g3863, partial [Chaetothyriales sp. CBS 134916]
MSGPTVMKAVDIKNGAGPSSALFINDQTPVPNPTETQALVKIKAFGLNRMDLIQREGHYPVPPQAPKTLGVEFSGVIVSFGSKDHGSDFAEGDEVFGLAYGGAYAEYIAASIHMLVKKPKELNWVEAAGIPEAWITATQALYQVGGFDENGKEAAHKKSVLWHAGASSVSIAGIQLCVGDGAKAVYVTASSQEKIDFCKSLGATAGFSYKSDTPWDKQLLEYTNGYGADLIIDFVGGSYFSQNLEAAAKDGRIVNLAGLGGTTIPAGTDIGRFLRKRLRYEGSSLRSRDENYQRKLRNTLVEHALPRFINGKFKVIVEKVFKMEEIKEAHDLMATNMTKGKLICTVD